MKITRQLLIFWIPAAVFFFCAAFVFFKPRIATTSHPEGKMLATVIRIPSGSSPASCIYQVNKGAHALPLMRNISVYPSSALRALFQYDAPPPDNVEVRDNPERSGSWSLHDSGAQRRVTLLFIGHRVYSSPISVEGALIAVAIALAIAPVAISEMVLKRRKHQPNKTQQAKPR